MTPDRAPVAVTGANGLVGDHVCAALAARGIPVRAVVRRAGAAPVGDGVDELVADFTDPRDAAAIVEGASAVVSTVHPMADDRATQRRVGVDGTLTLARAAAGAGVHRLVHVSTAAVYDRRPGVGDVDEASALVGDDANDYAVTKRDLDLALAEVDGIARVLLRPPAVLGPGPTSVWNTLRPATMRDDPAARRRVPDASFAWVHVGDLAALAADLAGGTIPVDDDECVAANVAGVGGTQRDYAGAVCGALGVEPVWEDGPAWTGRILADRARGWGWRPTVDLSQALAELVAGLSGA